MSMSSTPLRLALLGWTFGKGQGMEFMLLPVP